jgi:hypothetical protein
MAWGAPWWIHIGTQADLTGRDDGLLKVAPVLARYDDLAGFLAEARGFMTVFAP